MSGVLVDSSVIVDVLTHDPVWYSWSANSLEHCANVGLMYVNPIIFAEVSIRFDTFEQAEYAVSSSDFIRLDIPLQAAFLACKAHLKYRKSGGTRTTTLPDFFIGAHAAVSGLQLLTRDSARIRTYFPTVDLIAP